MDGSEWGTGVRRVCCAICSWSGDPEGCHIEGVENGSQGGKHEIGIPTIAVQFSKCLQSGFATHIV